MSTSFLVRRKKKEKKRKGASADDMASGLPSIVLYAGSAATYLCEAGDVQPTYPFLQPISEELLRQLQLTSSTTALSNGADCSSSHMQHNAAWIRTHVFPLLRHRTMFLVLPLSSSASYREEWVRLCFHADVQVRRLVVVSDTVADGFACGCRSCVVLHASLNAVSVSRVEEGCSVRYGNSHVGSVQSLCGETVTAKLAEHLPTLAADVALRNATKQGSGSDDEEKSDAAADVSGMASCEIDVDLFDGSYRDELVHTFGYKAYCAAIAIPRQQQLNAESRSNSKGKGKGKGKGRAQKRGRASDSLLDALHHAYPRAVREAPGQLEKLLARVVQGSVRAVDENTEPCIVAGEALAVPCLQQLYTYVARHCGSAVWATAELERKARQRRRTQADHGTSDNAGRTRADEQHPGEAHHEAGNRSCRSPRTKLSDQTSSSGSSISTSEDEDSDDDSYDDDADNLWLHIQPTPLPSAPWWLPLLGASVISRLTDHDLQRALITEEEARESNGTIVHWKILL